MPQLQAPRRAAPLLRNCRREVARAVRVTRGAYARRMGGWEEVARGIHRRRYDPMDISVVAIDGPDGITVVDSRSTPAEAREIIADIEREFARPIAALIVTHAHFDHTFGNEVFAEAGIPIYGHQLVAAHHAEFESLRAEVASGDVVLTAPTHPINLRTIIAPGGRDIELIPLGPGHTDTDVAILVPDTRVWILGDIIEESGALMYGTGCFPLDWPGVLTNLADEIRPTDRIVPGHGRIVDREFVLAQRDTLAAVAASVRTGWADGVSASDAVARHPLGDAWPAGMLEPAFIRGYEKLNRETAK